MNETQRGIRRRRSAAGFSVVEVLVAISLLIVGIVAILELFPPGFAAINHTKNATLSEQVAAAYFQNLKLMNLDQVGVIASQVSPTMDGYNPTTNSVDAAYNLADHATPNADHNINSERIIGGEITRIPSTGVYTVNFGPIDLTAGAPANALAMNGSPWKGTQGIGFVGTSHSASGILARIQDIPVQVLTNDQPQYLVDYNQGAIALPYETAMGSLANGTGYVQVVQFSIVAADGNKYSTTINWDPTTAGKGTYWDIDSVSGFAEPLWFSPNPGPSTNWVDSTGAAVAAPTASNQLPWVAGSAVLGRNFKLVAGTGAFSPDPYEFALVQSNFAGTSANPGVLEVSPGAKLLRDGKGKAPVVKVTYWVADWHVIREDHTVTSLGTIRLSFGSVADVGDSLMPATSNYNGIYNGILDRTYPGANTPPIYIVDLDNGIRLVAGVDYSLDGRLYSTGVITLHAPQVYLNAKLRVYYRARGDWSVTVLKSPAFYTPNATLVNAGTQPADTLANVATYQVSAGGTRLLFPATDIGKMVQISGLHVVSGSVKSVINDASVYTIEAPDPTMLSNHQYQGYVDFAVDTTQPQGNSSGANILFTGGETINTSVPNPVDQVAGATITIRVVYYEQGQMRYRDFQSFLTPGQSI